MFGIGIPEMIVIAVVGLVVFGNRLPSAMKSVGQAVVQFKKGLRDTQEEIERASEEDNSKGGKLNK